MGDFKQLVVWRKAFALVAQVYRMAADFPQSERFELSSQVRRAAVSIAANIAEGAGRVGAGDQSRFYRIALASARELECLLLLARKLSFVSPADHAAAAVALDEVQRMLLALARRISASRALALPSRR